jgi:hypothetical protein
MTKLPKPDSPKEKQILAAILQFLAAKHILAFRMNVLAMPTGDGKRFIKAGVPGMADVLAFKVRRTGWLTNPAIEGDYAKEIIIPLWIEAKTEKGKQSDLQRSFQLLVESYGHRYVICRGVEDVENTLK